MYTDTYTLVWVSVIYFTVENIILYNIVFVLTLLEVDTEEGLAATLEAIAQLPPANKDTLAFIMLHLQR